MRLAKCALNDRLFRCPLTIEIDQAVANSTLVLHQLVKVLLHFFLNSSLPDRTRTVSYEPHILLSEQKPQLRILTILFVFEFQINL
jgi:hypothetical protein